jgi:hypothetical protein
MKTRKGGGTKARGWDRDEDPEGGGMKACRRRRDEDPEGRRDEVV